MIKIKQLSECPLKDASEAWNIGFADYYSNAQMSVSAFTFRLGLYELAPEFSYVAYAEGEPIGLILNGIKEFHGQKWAWNGGTNVAASHRRSGIGKELMAATLELYTREGVNMASLEAFRVNERAIQLYNHYGYQTVDHLLFLEKREVLDATGFSKEQTGQYTILRGIPQDVSRLSFYNHHAPWQVRWEFIRAGESVLARNESGNVVGYALFQRRLNDEGKLRAVVLYQCQIDENEPDIEHVIRAVLNHVFPAVSYPYTRSTYLLPETNEGVVRLLRAAGFLDARTPEGIPFEQVYMVKQMAGKSR